MVEGMEEGWTEGWTEGWREGWWKGWRKGGREAGMEEGMEVGGMEEGGMGRGWRDGWMNGWTEGRTQGLMEAETEGGMEAGMLEGGMGKGWMEGWREGWKNGWKYGWDLNWMSREDEEEDSEREGGKREGGRDGGMGWREGWKTGYRDGCNEGWLQGGIVGMMDGGTMEWKDFGCDIDKFETAMELIDFMKEIIYHPPLETFLSKGRYNDLKAVLKVVAILLPTTTSWCPLDGQKQLLKYVEIFLPTTTFRVQSHKDRQRVFDNLVSLARLVMDFMGEVTQSSGKKFPRSESYNFRSKWIAIVETLGKICCLCGKWESDREKRRQSMFNVVDAVKNPLYDVNNILPKLELSDITPDLELCLKNKELLLLKAFPALGELEESSEMVNFLLEVTDQLQEPIKYICELCKGSSLAVLLIGSLLSLKQPDDYTWGQVCMGLAEFVKYEYSEDNQDNQDNDDSDYLTCILDYCMRDLSSHLRLCFYYSACYPIGSEILATRLTEIWIADGLVKPEKGETLEDIANKYLEEFVQRSLVWVSRRSSSGTIKYFQIPRVIHEVALEVIRVNPLLHVNPTKKRIKDYTMDRVVILPGNNNQYREVKFEHLRSFLASDLDRDILGRCPNLRVLELRNSTIRDTILSKLHYLQHLGLRGSNIRMLPENIGNLQGLQTLDVRDTSIETLPESLWDISALRHVYANPRPQIQGPPPTAILSNLQTLKTVVVPESWLKNFPHSMINLRKLALSNMDNPTCKPNPYWESISKMLSRLVNLHSMRITGDIVPAEFADTRAFPNLDTVNSIKLEGKWNYFKLTIDNNGFPPNLTKLILTKSGLKEDPMPRLERLQALKYLSLKDGAYMGKKMVCSANRFPQLDFLELSELMNLEIWDADPKAMPQLTKLRVIKCCKLDKLPIQLALSLSLV